jgi:putative aldouronate transport system permease protein
VDSAKRRSAGDKVFDAVLFALLSAIFIIVAYPLYFILISSISDPIAVSQGKVLFMPISFTLDGYLAVFREESVLNGYLNSLIYTVVGVSINLICTVPTGYALSRKDFFARKPVTFFFLITMFISGGLYPTYMVVRNTGLLNSMWALVIPGAIWVYNLIVCRTFFLTNIPDEMLDAARIDGCGNTRFFLNIVLPLSASIIAIMVLYYGVGHWNSYFGALLYINDRAKWPLQMELRTILLQNAMSASRAVMNEQELAEKARLQAIAELMKYSLIVVSCVPMMVLYPFIQKHFIRGVMIGSIKG